MLTSINKAQKIKQKEFIIILEYLQVVQCIKIVPQPKKLR